MTNERAPTSPLLTPSALTRLAREVLESNLANVWIEGELTNVSRPASGHLYFTLKDAGAQVRCAMFKPRSTWLPFKPGDGLKVLARGRVSLYEARGEFQLIIEHMEQSGEGALRLAFEQLKTRLAAEGLFAESNKRPIPAMPQRIGIITSATGAALHDVLHVLGRRFPLIEVELLPTPVQGKEAPPAIIAMLDATARARRHDVLLLTRGGGSLEDLWAFNDEGVARAIARNPIPLVSAIGHEVDFSISDLVADLRAATPSAAAELLVPDAREINRRLQHDLGRLHQRMRRLLQAASQRNDHLLARLSQQRPQTRLDRGHQRLAQAQARMARLAQHEFAERRSRLLNLQTRLHSQHPGTRLAFRRDTLRGFHRRLENAQGQRIERRRARMQALGASLHALSPLATLSRGYAILLDEHSQSLVRSVQQAPAGTQLRAVLADGRLRLRVETGD